MVQEAADISWFVPIEIKVDIRLIGIAANPVTLEEFERDQCVEKVAGAARVQTSAFGEGL